jgi:spore germination cell wall hydrolase CwlJ-like protein
MKSIENFFHRNHSALIKFGGLIAICFLVIYSPMKLYLQYEKTIAHKSLIESELKQEMHYLENQLRFYQSDFDRQVKIRKEVECLAKNIYFEAGAEPRAGKIAVAEVTMNRVRNKHYPSDVCSVVYQKYKKTCQFSWVCQNKKLATNSKAWRDSIKIAENILISDKKYGIIGSATHFHANYVYPDWAETKKVVAEIGNHIFYR